MKQIHSNSNRMNALSVPAALFFVSTVFFIEPSIGAPLKDDSIKPTQSGDVSRPLYSRCHKYWQRYCPGQDNDWDVNGIIASEEKSKDFSRCRRNWKHHCNSQTPPTSVAMEPHSEALLSAGELANHRDKVVENSYQRTSRYWKYQSPDGL